MSLSLSLEGDNEWSDCHKTKQWSSGSPLSELAAVRELFFAKPGYSLGTDEMEVTTQAEAYTDPADAQFVENVMWKDKLNVVFATFNIPGGSNDDADTWTGIFSNTAAQLNERTVREAANLRWLDKTFAYAKSKNARGIVIALQADMWDTEKYPNLTNYKPFVQKLANLALSFGKPVLVLNGDSHVYKVDQPLIAHPTLAAATANCNTQTVCDLSTIHNIQPEVPNLTRIVVQGSGDGKKNSWIKLTISTPTYSNPKPDLFSWEEIVYLPATV
jgi:hypothetical protein